jgi:hypothetical protein
MKQKTYSIYALRNSVTNEVGYIGKTNDISKRFKQHMSEARINDDKPTKNIGNPRKVFWIHSNIDNIVIDELEAGISTDNEAAKREVFYIDKLSKEGHNLTNSANIMTFPYHHVRFNRKSAQVFDRYPGGYFIASSQRLDWYLLGKFLFSRDYFFDSFHSYTNGLCELNTLQDAYESMLSCKKTAEISAKGYLNMHLGCGGKIRETELGVDYPNWCLPENLDPTLLERNSCASIYCRLQNKFTWNEPHLKLCAISVASNGTSSCKARTKHDFERELQLKELFFLSETNKQKQLLMADLSNNKVTLEEFKKLLQQIMEINERFQKIMQLYSSNNMSIENFLIQCSNLSHALKNS